MSIYSCTSPDKILNCPLNSSKSKFHYSVPKSRRFPKYSTNCQKAFYGYNSQLSRVAAVVGTGPRSDFTKTTSIAPGPTLYNIPNKIDLNLEKKVGQTFGLARETLKDSGYVTQHILSNPGVGQYSINTVKPRKQYTMRPKTANRWLPPFLQNDETSDDPGPGNYSYTDVDRAKLGRSVNAKYKSVPASSIAKSKRFWTPTQKTPGPCTYSKPDPLNDSGLYRVSWYKGNGKRVWNKEKRRSFIDAASKSAYGPGPGQYRQVSEFGHYDFLEISNTSFYKTQPVRRRSYSGGQRPTSK